MIPLVHDFSTSTILVVGGGPVAARKARRFSQEADVVVLSPAFAEESFGDADKVQQTVEPAGIPALFERFDPALLVAATDDEPLNEALESQASDAGVLCNRVDRSGSRDLGSVVVPATVEDDPVTVSISTGGTSPTVSKHLRRRLEDELEHAGAMADLTSSLRAELQNSGVPPERRREALEAVVESEPVWKALGSSASNAEIEAAVAVNTVLEEPL